ncbi:MAG: carboxypeptidase-like regulatory domain-containing protein [Dysgonamonadaceae bacterium]|jgi:protocatechuate 3,4-dioxygenase beta subunit|nr:carboxypeptidase-like regulatory domain-containing protein [Dysgonamonadaceae bacterium]
MASCSQHAITISGQVTDFNGNPVDSCIVEIFHPDFSTTYETYTNGNGYYAINNVKKGKYMALYAIRVKMPFPKKICVWSFGHGT